MSRTWIYRLYIQASGLMDEEGLQDTANEMIHIGHPIEMDDEWFEDKLKLLDKVSRQDSARIKEIVAEIVPTYHYKKEK